MKVLFKATLLSLFLSAMIAPATFASTPTSSLLRLFHLSPSHVMRKCALSYELCGIDSDCCNHICQDNNKCV